MRKAVKLNSNIITVTPKVSPSITAVTQIQPILCHGDASGAIEIEIDRTTGLLPFDITITGQTTGHTETITDSFDYEIIFSGLPADTYDIILQDAKGCQAVHSITISEPDPITFDLNQSYITCIPGGTSLGEIIIENVIGGTAPYTIIGEIILEVLISIQPSRQKIIHLLLLIMVFMRLK